MGTQQLGGVEVLDAFCFHTHLGNAEFIVQPGLRGEGIGRLVGGNASVDCYHFGLLWW